MTSFIRRPTAASAFLKVREVEPGWGPAPTTDPLGQTIVQLMRRLLVGESIGSSATLTGATIASRPGGSLKSITSHITLAAMIRASTRRRDTRRFPLRSHAPPLPATAIVNDA